MRYLSCVKVPIPFLSLGSFGIVTLISLSCVGSPGSPPLSSFPGPPASIQAKGDTFSPGLTKGSSRGVTQKRIVESAQSLVGLTQLRFEKAAFSSDCSGFVLAAYYLAGIDLRKEYGLYEGNGVRRLYQIALSHNLVSSQKNPTEGDILFWDNTYDANGDGKLNDELTHTGIVVAVYPDGQVDYIHYHVSRGIVRESMNFNYPGDVHLNAPMRIREPGKPRPEKWLAAQLYRAYGRLWRLGVP